MHFSIVPDQESIRQQGIDRLLLCVEFNDDKRFGRKLTDLIRDAKRGATLTVNAGLCGLPGYRCEGEDLSCDGCNKHGEVSELNCATARVYYSLFEDIQPDFEFRGRHTTLWFNARAMCPLLPGDEQYCPAFSQKEIDSKVAMLNDFGETMYKLGMYVLPLSSLSSTLLIFHPHELTRQLLISSPRSNNTHHRLGRHKLQC